LDVKNWIVPPVVPPLPGEHVTPPLRPRRTWCVAASRDNVPPRSPIRCWKGRRVVHATTAPEAGEEATGAAGGRGVWRCGFEGQRALARPRCQDRERGLGSIVGCSTAPVAGCGTNHYISYSRPISVRYLLIIAGPRSVALTLDGIIAISLITAPPYQCLMIYITDNYIYISVLTDIPCPSMRLASFRSVSSSCSTIISSSEDISD